MTELFGDVRSAGRQGLLFDHAATRGFAEATPQADATRRPGETNLDYRIRRQYRDVAATAPLFSAHVAARR
jgi:hypothetical protein